MAKRFFNLRITALLIALLGLHCSILSAHETSHPFPADIALPQSLSLCNEPVPLENRSVREMLDREFIISVCDRAQVFLWLKRGGRYFPYLEKKLAEAGMPQDLKYLAVAESALLTHIKSNKGALGPWQFMKSTARHNGLRKDRMADERLSFEKSTAAALKFLQRLKDKLGSWTLAMAAYNCGAARLKKAIKAQKVSDYYRLNLPQETERYIFRIAAVKIIMENPEQYGYVLSPANVYKPVECDTVPVKISVPLHITDIAQAMGTDCKVIKELNPQILGYYLPTGNYTIKVPWGMGPKTLTVVQELARKAAGRMKVAGTFYKVRPGDTLSHIALRTGVSLATLKSLNGIDGDFIRVGRKLRVRP